MDFDFDQDQYMLRDSVRSYLSDAWGPRMLRAADGAHAPELWSGLCGLGLQTLPIAEAYGGAGLNDAILTKDHIALRDHETRPDGLSGHR